MMTKYAHEVVPLPETSEPNDRVIYHAARLWAWWQGAMPGCGDEATRALRMQIATDQMQLLCLWKALAVGAESDAVTNALQDCATDPSLIETTAVRILTAAGIDPATIAPYGNGDHR